MADVLKSLYRQYLGVSEATFQVLIIFNVVVYFSTKTCYHDLAMRLGLLLLHWFVVAVVFLVVSYVFPGITVANVCAALLAALVLGLVNTFIRPIVKLLAFPITFLTLGLFTFVINAFMVLLTSWIVPGFGVAGFWWALLIGAILSGISWLFHYLHT